LKFLGEKTLRPCPKLAWPNWKMEWPQIGLKGPFLCGPPLGKMAPTTPPLKIEIIAPPPILWCENTLWVGNTQMPKFLGKNFPQMGKNEPKCNPPLQNVLKGRNG